MSTDDLQALLRLLMDYEEHLAASSRVAPSGFDSLLMQVDTELNAGGGNTTPPKMLNDVFSNLPASAGADGVFDPFGHA